MSLKDLLDKLERRGTSRRISSGFCNHTHSLFFPANISIGSLSLSSSLTSGRNVSPLAGSVSHYGRRTDAGKTWDYSCRNSEETESIEAFRDPFNRSARRFVRNICHLPLHNRTFFIQVLDGQAGWLHPQ
jgi:hypothetical protein